MIEVPASKNVLKDFPTKLLTSSYNERKFLFSSLEVSSLEEKDGLSEVAAKEIAKLLPLTLPRYVHGWSRTLIENFLNKSPDRLSPSLFRGLLSGLRDYYKNATDSVATRSNAKIALSALKWITILFRRLPVVEDDEIKQFLELNRILATLIVGGNCSKTRFYSKKILNQQWKGGGPACSALVKQLMTEPISKSMAYEVFFFECLLVHEEDVSHVKALIIDGAIKNVIASKTRANLIFVENLREVLRQISREEFEKHFLSAILKSLLRNPEIVMGTVATILKHLVIDLGSYIEEFTKHLKTNLHAKDDGIREDTVSAVGYLVKNCKESAKIEHLLDAIFAVFNGKEGKISVISQKLSLLEAAGKIKENSLDTSSLQQLAFLSIDHFIKVLESESHEHVLISGLDNILLWCDKCSLEISSKLINWLPKGMNLKTTTANVRLSYLLCMYQVLTLQKEKTLEFLPSLTQCLDNLSKQSGQISAVYEGVIVSGCIFQYPEHLNDVKKYLNAASSTLAQDRCLQPMTYHVLLPLIYLASEMVISHSDVSVNWFKILSVGLLNEDKRVRQYSLTACQKIQSGLQGKEFTKTLMHELTTLIFHSNSSSASKESNWGISWKIVKESLKIFRSPSDEFGKELLFPCHSYEIQKESFQSWSQLMNSNTKKWVEDNGNNIVNFIKEKMADPHFHQAISRISKTMVKIAPDTWKTETLLWMETIILRNNISVTDYEYNVFKTPKGELYDSSIISSSNDTGAANIKRENKAYSYKEQMEEIALRKEIEEKKRKEGKFTSPKLTPKQQEAFNAQLKVESQVREKVEKIINDIIPFDVVFASAIDSYPEAFETEVGPIFKLLFASLKNKILLEKAKRVLFFFRHAFSYLRTNDSLAQIAANILYNIQCPNPQIVEKDLKLCLEKFIDNLHSITDGGKIFSPPTFHFCFPVIKKALTSSIDDGCFHKGLEIISRHCSIRGPLTSIMSPKYLPRTEILKVLINLISNLSGRSQQSVICVIIDVAESASGKSGCDTISEEEVEILLGALQCEVAPVRDASLRCLKIMLNDSFKMYTKFNFLRRILIARFDESEEHTVAANEIWQKIDLSVQPEMAFDLISDIKHPNHCIRQASSSAIAFLFEKDVSNVSEILKILLDVYSVNLNMTPPVKDNLGRVISESIDHWEARSGVALSINKISPFFDSSMVRSVISFLVPQGLSDRNDTVRKYMLDAAVTTIDLHGKDSSNELLPVFEDFMENAPASGVYDSVRQSVVVLMGSLARHLDPDSPKVKTILRQLILALNTPSQQVQEAVANCLPPLVPSIKSEAPSIINTLINTLIGSDISYGDRKGAAYGIAGIVKGLGILSLKQCDVMSKLSEAIANKKNPTHREGALFAFEMLCTMLGRLFEPYIVHILPHLLLCFGDPIDHVRLAADDTTKAVMKKLSAHGVKLVLPSLLDALEKDQWRTKTGSIELLGAMAYCAPKQLSSCLPSIVPKLIAILGDSHHKVQNAGAQALRQIGSVIKNPEIQAIVPVLLKALQDPAKKTGHCLQILLETKFVHFIDAPSLALIMPVVQRAFQDRSTETRKMAAQIIGNMYSLTDQKDLSPYLPGIIPGLKASLLDPVPEVRAVSARALGAMVKGIGESSFEELLPWLMSTLTSESSSVDRSGAAQGLAEVVGGLGVEKMDALMPDIIKTTERMDIAPHVKDGYIMMFIYMPLVFPDEFRQYIGKIISPILRALADENEFVRETAYKSGQRLVVTYAESAIELLLPELEKGLFEDNWRIRHSSIQLLGDLLYKISGVSGKMSTETSGEDDNFGTEQSQKVIVETLGEERRNRVLAGLYMGRSDVALMVRQASLHVWKVIVSNTPKTLREILPTLFNLLLGCLASSSFDKRQVAARTLGDLVKKLGERVLPEIIPILEEGLKSNQPEKRQGVCVGLSEIMASTSREMVLTFVDSLVPTVKKALCDDLSEVREAAAKTFDSLHNTVGSRALDDILPYMLKQLDDEDRHENTLDGLRQVIMIKSRAVLPYLIPKLISPPVNSKALASLAPVAGEALHRHLPRILPSLIASLSKALSTPDEGSELSYVQSVILSVKDDQDDSGVSYIMEELISSCKSDDMNLKKSSVMLLNSFCSQTKTSYLQYVPQLIRILILLFTESDNIVLVEAWNTLNSITKGLDNAELMDLVPDVRQALRFALMDNEGKDLLAGFCLPKGITPILPIFRESILNGSPELKEQAAVGLGEVIKVTSPESLKPSVVHITGPLIRILGDRFAPSVKVAVLETLATLLSRAGVMLKPFFPQLQTTFLKALNDTTRSVRLKAGLALSYLITIHVRPDPLFNEILVGIKNADDASFRDTYLQALRGCITPDGGEKMTPAIRKQVLTVLLGFLQHPEETSRVVGSGCIGALCKWMTPEELTSTLDGNILTNSPSMDEAIRHGKSCALFVALKETSEKVFEGVRKPVINSVVQGYLSSDSIQVVRNGIKSIGYIFQHHFKREEEVPSELILPFCKCMNHASNDVKRLVAVMGNHLAKMNYASILPSNFLKPLIPMLVNGTKEKNTAVKSSSEFALISLLHLREAKDYQKCLEVLDAGGAREALQDVVSKVLQKMANQPDGDEEVVDDTILV